MFPTPLVKHPSIPGVNSTVTKDSLGGQAAMSVRKPRMEHDSLNTQQSRFFVWNHLMFF